MLSVVMIDRLNRQIQLEQFSSNLYLQMSAWCDHQGYTYMDSSRFASIFHCWQ